LSGTAVVVVVAVVTVVFVGRICFFNTFPTPSMRPVRVLGYRVPCCAVLNECVLCVVWALQPVHVGAADEVLLPAPGWRAPEGGRVWLEPLFPPQDLERGLRDPCCYPCWFVQCCCYCCSMLALRLTDSFSHAGSLLPLFSPSPPSLDVHAQTSPAIAAGPAKDGAKDRLRRELPKFQTLAQNIAKDAQTQQSRQRAHEQATRGATSGTAALLQKRLAASGMPTTPPPVAFAAHAPHASLIPLPPPILQAHTPCACHLMYDHVHVPMRCWLQARVVAM
jgi:hypothetical protein